MSTTFGVTRELDAALRHGFSVAGVRIAPDTQMTAVIASLTAIGIVAAVEDGILTLTQGSTSFNVSQALRSFANKPEQSSLFITDSSDPKEWSTAQKMAFITKHGADAWAKKISVPVARPDVKPLDPNMSFEDYGNLTSKEKISFIAEFGDGAVRKIFSRRKPTKAATPAVKNRLASNRIEDYA